MVMIGIDPHKRTHTAVAIDTAERVLDERLVRATSKQVPELLEWVKRLDGGDRIWAIESAGGLGYLLAQQLLAAGEHVVDVPATLASRVRLLGTGRSDKNDPNDARSVAIAALRAAELVPVRVEDHASVLRLVSRRHTQLGWSYNKTACRLHALVADLVPGGISNQVVVCQARSFSPTTRRLARWPQSGTRSPLIWLTSSSGSTASARRSASGSPSPSTRQARRSPRSSASVTWAPPSSSARSATSGGSGPPTGSLPTTAPPPSRGLKATRPGRSTGSPDEATAP